MFDYYYNGVIKKTVAVFGKLFSDIEVKKTTSTGAVISTLKVPLAYGPKQKFLARIHEAENLEANDRVQIKVPRMSFEIRDIEFDSVSALNRNNVQVYAHPDVSMRRVARQSIPYNIIFELSVLSNTQDDAFQIIEQIIPHFRPEYTVTVKDMEGPGSRTDIPFSLTGITPNDEYEGQFENRRTIIHTLNFTAKIKIGGPISNRGVIDNIDIDFFQDNGDDSDGFFEELSITADSEDGPITTTITTIDDGY